MKTSGFTLIEIMLSVAAIAILAGISVPIYQSFQVRNDLDIAAVEIAQSLRRAQILSEASDGDIGWGIKILPASLTVFKGLSYTARDAAYDEIFAVPASITASGLSEIVFAKFSGLPLSTGTTTLTSNANEIRNITINAKGTVGY